MQRFVSDRQVEIGMPGEGRSVWSDALNGLQNFTGDLPCGTTAVISANLAPLHWPVAEIEWLVTDSRRFLHLLPDKFGVEAVPIRLLARSIWLKVSREG